jgi:hypothetical protein
MLDVQSRKNIYSQDGEDSIIAQLCSHLRIDRGNFCEFGAWDGIHLSNCRALYEKGWSGIFIEGDKRKFAELTHNYKADARIICVNEYVSREGDTTLDAIFRKVGVTSMDLLSIDIDSDDLAIWKSLNSVRPKIVIVEYNYTIPFDTHFENPMGEAKGNSALSIVEYAKQSNYVLVAGTGANLFFVDKQHAVGVTPEISLPSLRKFIPSPRYFFGYDGTLIVSHYWNTSVEEVFYIPWTTTLATQPLPKFLRGHAGSAGYIRYVRYAASRISALLRRPLSTLKWMWGHP